MSLRRLPHISINTNLLHRTFVPCHSRFEMTMPYCIIGSINEQLCGYLEMEEKYANIKTTLK